MQGKMNQKYTDSGNKKWYHEYSKEISPCKHTKTELEVINLKNEAKKHLDGETAAFQLKQSKSKDSEYEWLKTALTKGTGQDKIASAIVLIQDNPKYNLGRLTGLIAQVKSSKHNQSNLLITSLRDLFVSDLLHPDCKLLKFEDQNLDKIPSSNLLDTAKVEIPRNRLLSHWYFEDQLKEQYEKFITALAAVASDTVDANRELAITVMNDLLIGNSEQEHKLLEFLVNKVGDPRPKVASKAVFCLNKLLLEHPNMKLVVLREIEKLLFRTNIAQRAQYYAICLLSQFVLNREDSDTATTLIDVYFAFFKACLKKGEPDSRMMAAILTGVNRAYRFANLDVVKLNDHVDSVYKVVHVGSFNVSLNALSLLHQVVGKNPEQENRFYTTFYRKLLDPQIGTANKRAVFLNLLYRVMKSDKSATRLYAFVKRTLQVAMYFPACMICALLYVISQVLETRKDLKQMLSRSPQVIKKEEEVKDELLKQSVEDGSDNEDDVIIEENTIMLSNVIANNSTTVSTDTDIKDVIKIEEDDAAYYDPFCINPLRSGASKSPIVELRALVEHVHPSVALFATNIVEGKTIHYTGDPLEDLTLIRFLDRYVFKNPKKLDEKKVAKSNDPLAVRAKYAPKGLRSIPVGSQAYLNENEDRIPVDELFLYRYLRMKNDNGNIHVEDDESDNESVNSEEFNEMLDRFSGDKDFEELDIAADIGSSKKQRRLANDDNDDDDDDNDNDDGNDVESIEDSDAELEGSDDISDENEDAGSMKDDDMDMSDIDFDGIDDEDLSDMEFNDGEDWEDESSGITRGSNSKINKALKKGGKSKGIDKNVFVSAEEFAEILEEQGRSKRKQGGSDMFSDADGANVKQLDWETTRNQKLSGKFGGKKRLRANSGFKTNKNVKKFKRKH